MKKVVSIILALVLTMGAVPSTFAESLSADSQEPKTSVDYDDRFAETIKVEIKSKSVAPGTGGIPGVEVLPDMDVEYSDRWFTDSSFKLNPHLPTLSSTAIVTCFSYERAVGEAAEGNTENGENVTGLLNECGFNDVQSNKYYFLPTEEHSVGCVAGHKTIQVGDKNYTLLAVIPASPGYGQEWVGNFTVGDGSMHQGFKAARDEVLRFLRNYMSEHEIKGDLKVWISGYSRFAAVANLVGGFFAGGGAGYFDDVTVDPENVYCFSFAPPTVIDPDKALKKEALSVAGYRGDKDERYKNDSAGEPYTYAGSDANELVKPHGDEFNGVRCCKPDHDLVPQLPPEKWGMDRYGVDLPLTDGKADTKTRMKAEMQELYPDMYKTYVNGGDEDDYTWKTIDFEKAAIVDDTSCKDPISQAWMFYDRVNNGLARRADSTEEYVEGGYEAALCAVAGIIGMDVGDFIEGVTKDKMALIKAGVFSYLSYAVERLEAERGYTEEQAIAVAVEELLELVFGRKINPETFTFDDFLESFAKFMVEDSKYKKIIIKDPDGYDTEVYADIELKSKTAELLFDMLTSTITKAISEDAGSPLPGMIPAYDPEQAPDSEYNQRSIKHFLFYFMTCFVYSDGDQDNPGDDPKQYRLLVYTMVKFMFGSKEGLSDLIDAMGKDESGSIDGSGKFSKFIAELIKILRGEHKHVADAADEALSKVISDGVQAALSSGTFAEGSLRYQEFEEHGDTLLANITAFREVILDLLFYDIDQTTGEALPFNTARNIRYATTFVAQVSNIMCAHMFTTYDSWMRAMYTVDAARKEVIELLKVIGEENADQAMDKEKYELILMRQLNAVRDAKSKDEVEAIFADAKDKIKNYIEVEQIAEAKARAERAEQLIQEAVRQAVEEAERARKAAEDAEYPVTITAVVLSDKVYTYDGKVHKPEISVVIAGDKVVTPENYEAEYSGGDSKNAGKYTVKVTGKGDRYVGSASAAYTIRKAANPVKVSGKKVSVNYTSLKKDNKTVKRAKAITVKNEKTALSYKLKSVSKSKYSKYFKVNKKTGNITVKKGLKKGTYKLSINVSAASNNNYEAKASTAAVKVKVK